MSQGFWTTDDFEVFSIEGLEYRMNALQTQYSTKVRTNWSTDFRPTYHLREQVNFSLMSQSMHGEQSIRRTTAGLHLHRQNEDIRHCPISKSDYGGHICSSFSRSFMKIQTKKALLKGLGKNVKRHYILA